MLEIQAREFSSDLPPPPLDFLSEKRRDSSIAATRGGSGEVDEAENVATIHRRDDNCRVPPSWAILAVSQSELTKIELQVPALLQPLA